MNELSKDQQDHFDSIIKDNKYYFDKRITSCSSDILKKFEEYSTTPEIREMHNRNITNQLEDKKRKDSFLKDSIIKIIDDKIKTVDDKIDSFKASIRKGVILIITILTFVLFATVFFLKLQ